MPEKVLALGLSGEEVRRAIVDRVSQALQKDCYLSPNTCYDFFDCNVKISLRCHDVGRIAEVKVDETISAGENPDELLEIADAEFNLDPAPPNEIRVETGQEVPVLTKSVNGKPEIKGIRYGRNKAKKAV